MITQAQAEQMFEQMIKQSGAKISIDFIIDAQFEEPLYIAVVIDESGEQDISGTRLPAIRKSDGELVDFEFPCPA